MGARKLTAEETRQSVLRRLAEYSVIDPATGCHVWMRCIGYAGYGSMRAFGKPMDSHRAAWVAAHGEIGKGPDGKPLGVLHRCDNRKCVNPEHLFLGTQADNMSDMAAKGRRKGERHHLRKLTDEQVQLIKSCNERPSELARRFGVHQSNICHIRSGRIWSHIGA